jgi:hypothetical protein
VCANPRTSGQLRGILFTSVNGIRITLTFDVNSKWKLWPDSEGMCAICMQEERQGDGERERERERERESASAWNPFRCRVI